MKPWRYGTVTVATPAGSPTVKLDGETTAAPCTNYVAGYPTPVVNDRVTVLVDGGDRILIGVKQ